MISICNCFHYFGHYFNMIWLNKLKPSSSCGSVFVLFSLVDNCLHFLDLRLQITTWIYSNFAYTDEYMIVLVKQTIHCLYMSLMPMQINMIFSDYLRLFQTYFSKYNVYSKFKWKNQNIQYFSLSNKIFLMQMKS